jgi:hypothetical protein
VTTTPASATTVCPGWCSVTCHLDDSSLHVQEDTVLHGDTVLALSRDDAGDGVTCVWVNDVSYPLDQAEEIGRHMLRLADAGRQQ